MAVIPCAHCGVEIKQKTSNHKFCTTKCKAAARPKRKKKERLSDNTYTCQHCGKPYRPPVKRESFTKHCSRSCHNKAVSRARTTEKTIRLRKELILDQQDEHLRDKVVFNSVDRPYIQTPQGPKQMTGLARYMLNAPEGMDIDHINRNFMDNRRENLRVCTRAENINNQGPVKKRNPKNAHLPKGVSFLKGRYYATIRRRVDGKLESKSLGGFDCPKEAGKAYDREKQKRTGLITNPLSESSDRAPEGH